MCASFVRTSTRETNCAVSKETWRSGLRTSRPTIAIVVLVFSSVNLHAQQRNATQDEKQPVREQMLVPFMEGTDVFLTSPKDTIFEARIAPHLVIKTFGDVLNLSEQERAARGQRPAPRLVWILSATPAVRLRMLRQNSDPVRTPSYMPRANVQALFARGVAEKVGQSLMLPGPAKEPQVTLYEWHTIVGHHSNGQDGCFYAEPTQSRPVGNPNGDCVPVLNLDAATAQPLVNGKDGSFSTNYIRIGMNYRRTRIDQKLVDDQDWTIGIELEQNFHIDPYVYPLYGRTRWTGSAAFAGRPRGQSDHWWDQEHWWTCDARREVKGFAKYIAGHPSTVKPFVLSAEAACFPSTVGGWGWFVRYYYGQDYYNIAFLDNISRWQLGMTFSQDGFFRFRRAS